MTCQPSITVHCWLPNLNLLAVGLLLGGGAAWGGAFLLLGAFSWLTNLKLLAGVAVLTYWTCYCRVRVTPYEVRVLSSGIWKTSYRCPLEEAAIGNYWMLPELAAQANYYSACLNFSSEEDWDTGIEYVEIAFYGEQLLNCFRHQQDGDIYQALRKMADLRQVLDASTKQSCISNRTSLTS